jgi:hypothetical protein
MIKCALGTHRDDAGSCENLKNQKTRSLKSGGTKLNRKNLKNHKVRSLERTGTMLGRVRTSKITKCALWKTGGPCSIVHCPLDFPKRSVHKATNLGSCGVLENDNCKREIIDNDNLLETR